MRRLFLLLLLALPGLSTIGCRACSSYTDCAPPVANCDCAHCTGGARAGSTIGVYPDRAEAGW